QQIETNPFLNNHEDINNICLNSGVSMTSVTYDAAMQKPLVSNGKVNNAEVTLLGKVLENARALGVKILVLPLVDESSVSDRDYTLYVKLLNYIGEKFLDYDLKIAIESDFIPKKLINFIEDIDCDWIGINYDIGNSAALGYNFDEEMKLTGKKILNIHVKDRPFGGATCPFGEGSYGLKNKINVLHRLRPSSNLIIQGARSAVGNDVGIAAQYFEYI
ncbi:sugar phosphate isomerase/epimerase, partial [Alphaproteobacteria bacterium]|nr:sugar phosphate isomerase/epimerase [Alphaproteobacteria bacterium]